MRALMWKEGREVLFKVLVGLAVCLLFLLLRQGSEFNEEFSSDFDSWAVTFGIVCALVLGMDVIAAERSRGTLHYLLERPLAVSKLVLVKFCAGGGALLLLAAGFWAAVYLMPLTTESSYGARILADVGYVKMVLVWFAFYVQMYSLVFLGSAVTDHQTKAVVAGGLVGMFLLLPVLFVANEVPVVEYILLGLLDMDVDADGMILRLVLHSILLWGRLGFTVLLAACLFGVAVWALTRYREASLGWRAILIGWGGVVGCVALVSALPKGDSEFIPPTGKLAYDGASAEDLVLESNFAYIALDKGLSIVDVSMPTAPVEIGRVEDLLWSMQEVAVAGSSAYLVGRIKGLPSDSLGVVTIDISDPGQPFVQGKFSLAATDEIRSLVEVAVVGDGLYIGAIEGESAKLLAFDIRDRTRPQLKSTIELADMWAQLKQWSGVKPAEEAMLESSRDYIVESLWRKFLFKMQVVEHYAFLSTYSGLVILDLADLGRVVEVSRTELEMFDDYKKLLDVKRENLVIMNLRNLGWGRVMDVRGDRAYVQRSWPRSMAILDISDLRRPVEVGMVYWYGFEDDMAVHDGYIYSNDWDEIQVFKFSDYGMVARLPDMGLEKEDKRGGGTADVILRDGHVYTLLGSTLVIYPLIESD